MATVVYQAASIDAPKHTPKFLRESNFKAFDGPHREEQIEAFQYLERMASITSADISHWDVLKVFENPQSGGKKIVTDRRAINKRLYECHDLEKKGLTVDLRGMESKLASFGKSIVETGRARQLTTLQSQFTNHKYNYEDYQRHFQNEMNAAWTVMNQIEALKASPPLDFVEITKKILEQGFWKFETLNEKELWFEFSNIPPVIMAAKNAKAGIDYKVYMGYYSARLYFGQSLSVRVFPKAENLKTPGGNYYHPYVSSTGNVCWGNASQTVQNHLIAGEFVEVFNLLSVLMTTYDLTSGPYVSLETFHAVAKENALRPAATEEPEEVEMCGTCDHEVDDCRCSACSICDEVYYEDRECNCCYNCDSTEDNCNCCGSCGETDEDCDRCRDCDRHEGHENGCSSEAPQPEGVASESGDL